MGVVKFISVIIWLAMAIGFGEIFIDFTKEMRVAAIKSHIKGPISHSLFTKQLTER